MISKGKNLSIVVRDRTVLNVSKIWIVVIFVILGAVFWILPLMDATATPVIIEQDSHGSWEDNFEDTTGIETRDNLELFGKDIRLVDMFYDNFTGINGDYPDQTKWNIIDHGAVLKISNAVLRTEAQTTGSPIWVTEMVETKDAFSRNHILTWKQYIQTVSSGMYYHFFILNGSDGSGIFGVNQIYTGQYQIYNRVTSSGLQIGSSVSGWHDYKVNFTNGYIEFYFDGVKKYEYNFNVSSVKYQFGADVQNCWSRVYTDDVLITSNVVSGNLTSREILLPNSQTWESLYIDKSEHGFGNNINVSILDGKTYLPIPGFENLAGTDIDISTIDIQTHPSIRLRAHFYGNGTATPVLHSWKVTWLDTIPPETPTGLTVTDPFTGYSLILSWDSNSEPDVTSYVLHYSIDNTTFYWIANVSADTLSFIHYGLSTGTTYYYKIAAADEIPNRSPFSEAVESIPDLDIDNDGLGNTVDNDDDNDGYTDAVEIAEGSDPLNQGSIPADNDRDFIPDSTDPDDDNDGVLDVDDDLPFNQNEAVDSDNDGIGNNGDIDDDNDGVPDYNDDFPLDNSEWNDLDGDGFGDNSDDDIDGDGYQNEIDNFDYNPNEWLDTDGDGIGNNADIDDDNDGYTDIIELSFGSDPLDDTLTPEDFDNDGIPNAVDSDDDNDGYEDLNDYFPLDNAEWNDLDEDGIGDNTDEDRDGDGIENTEDDFPTDPKEWDDLDEDGIGDNKDVDIDGDEVLNFNDMFPYDHKEWSDYDRDGIGDNSDEDKDGDGVPNDHDMFPLNAIDWKDTDTDGFGDNIDSDDDDDGYPDEKDDFPLNTTEWSDLDDDGIGDNSDDDIDGDGISNDEDKLPTNAHEWEDFDEDGIGDISDPDDDNDGHLDINEDYPYDASKWQKPNELLPLLYIILVLLVILIVIGMIMLIKTGKSIVGSRQESVESINKVKGVSPPQQESISQNIIEENYRTQEDLPPPPPPILE